MSGVTIKSVEFTDRQGIFKSIATIKDMRLSSIFKEWADVSKLNYYNAQQFKGEPVRKSFLYFDGSSFIENIRLKYEMSKTGFHVDFSDEEFPENVTSLMDIQNHWGCFYIFPGLYTENISPTVRVRRIHEVPDMCDGYLTRDVVSVCLCYLHRIPILKELVYIKLDVSSLLLRNIDVLEHYKFIVYLDLSDNFLANIEVLSNLLYLQYLSVSRNRLKTVLEYDKPQWFLSEVQYKYNCVTQIRDLTDFWSITVLNLSHNNIKNISGLENLKYLRSLDLSFNHIQKIENLNDLPLLWLDLSYNIITSYELATQRGLWTLQHLEYLNIEENKLVCFKLLTGCSRLTVLKARNNLFGHLLDMAVYMKQLRRLRALDLRENPVSSIVGYKDVVISTFPNILSLDENELDPMEVRELSMYMTPDINTYAIRRLQKLMYVEQLSRVKVSPFVPPADTREVPIVILVGYEALGKNELLHRLVYECGDHVEMAKLHTTAQSCSEDSYHKVTAEKFDKMLLAGDILAYSEIGGESYGLSRQEAEVKDGKVKVVCMNLISALMMIHRGRRPILILATIMDKTLLVQKQNERIMQRKQEYEDKVYLENRVDKSTLQVLVSGRILMRGIINEIILNVADEEEMHDDFIIESDCSLLDESHTRKAANQYIRDLTFLTALDQSSSWSNMKSKPECGYNNAGAECEEMLLCLHSCDKHTQDKTYKNLTATKSVDFDEDVSSKQFVNRACTSKTSHFEEDSTTKGRRAECYTVTLPTETSSRVSISEDVVIPKSPYKSISSNIPFNVNVASNDDDLWLNFLLDTGLLQTSDYNYDTLYDMYYDVEDKYPTDLNLLLKNIDQYNKVDSSETFFMKTNDDFECIHRLCPGLFRNTISMDDPDEAFHKLKGIIKDIVSSQKILQPMFNINFQNADDYPNYQERLQKIKNNIAPYRVF